MDSVPLVVITGQVSSDQIGRDVFQEVDITGVTMPITKHNYLVKDVNRLADVIREAFYLAKTGRPGPLFTKASAVMVTSNTSPSCLALCR